VAAWMALIFFLSSGPLPPAGKALPDWANHAIGYGVLSILACRALAGGLPAPLSFSRAAVAIAFCTLYGISDEWHQSFVPLRDANALDWLADTVGAVAGVTIMWLASRLTARLDRHLLPHRSS